MAVFDKTLLDLPVKPEDRDWAGETEIINETFLADRNAVKTVEDLHQFIDKWRNLWLLKIPNVQPTDEWSNAVDRIVAKDFDGEAVLAAMNRAKWRGTNAEGQSLDVNDYEKDPIAQLAGEIMLPFQLMEAFMLARHYGVTHDLAMVRFYLDPHPELIDALR